MAEEKQPVLFRIDPELWIRLKVVAARRRTTLQDVLTVAVEKYLEAEEASLSKRDNKV
jgi:predicted transcriptional regulator